jgi:hypothetical protein
VLEEHGVPKISTCPRQRRGYLFFCNTQQTTSRYHRKKRNAHLSKHSIFQKCPTLCRGKVLLGNVAPKYTRRIFLQMIFGYKK